MDLLDEIEAGNKKEETKKIEVDITALLAGIITRYGSIQQKITDDSHKNWLETTKKTLEKKLSSKKDKIESPVKIKPQPITPKNLYIYVFLPHNPNVWEDAISITKNASENKINVLKHYINYDGVISNCLIDIVDLMKMTDEGFQVPLTDFHPHDIAQYLLAKKMVEEWEASKNELENTIKALKEHQEKEIASKLLEKYKSYSLKTAGVENEWTEIKKIVDSNPTNAINEMKKVLEKYAKTIKQEYENTLEAANTFAKKIKEEKTKKESQLYKKIEEITDALITGKIETNAKSKKSGKTNTFDETKTIEKNLDELMNDILEELLNEKEKGNFEIEDRVVMVKALQPCSTHGINCASSSYQYGGYLSEVPLGTKGKVEHVQKNPPKVRVKIDKKDLTWSLHPNEIDHDYDYSDESNREHPDRIAELLLEGLKEDVKENKPKGRKARNAFIELIENAREEISIQEEARKKGIEPELIFHIYNAKPGAVEKAKQKIPEFLVKLTEKYETEIAKNTADNVKTAIIKKYNIGNENTWHHLMEMYASSIITNDFEFAREEIKAKIDFDIQTFQQNLNKRKEQIEKAKAYLANYDIK